MANNVSTITGVPQVIANIQQQGIDYANNFNKEVSNRLRQLSQKMQIDMNNAIDRGPSTIHEECNTVSFLS